MKEKLQIVVRWALVPIAPVIAWFAVNLSYRACCLHNDDEPGEFSLTFIAKLFLDGAVVPLSAYFVAPRGKVIAASIVGTAYFIVFLGICFLAYMQRPLGVATFLKAICFFVGDIGGVVYAIKDGGKATNTGE